MPGIGIGIGLHRGNIIAKPSAPSGLSASFTVDTISGDLTWTDNSGGTAQYEIYSSTNGGDYALLTTTSVGATSYSDTTCKQNASVVYRIRAKKGTLYSEYITATALVTPLCWKTNQTTRTNLIINSIVIAADKTVNIDYGDGENANLTGANTNLTHTYAASATNIFNIKLSGDLNSITQFYHFNQALSHGDITNWILPSALLKGYFTNLMLTGNLTETILPSSLNLIYLFGSEFTGCLPKIGGGSIGAMIYACQTSKFSCSNFTTFKTGMTVFDIKDQKVPFVTVEIDKLLKTLADWYQVNTPTADCTFNMRGANMGIPSLGASNVDLVRLTGYYTTAGFTATVVIRTS